MERPPAGLPGHRAVEWLRPHRILLDHIPKEKADLIHTICERIRSPAPEIVGVRLTTAAYAHGLALALPERL